jgi:hypothetical protein
MDREDIVGGADWVRSISHAINRADFFLACLTAMSCVKRGYLRKEILEALDKWREKLPEGVYLIPVKPEPCELPERLSRFQVIELFQDDGWRRLCSAFEVGIRRLEQEQTPGQNEGALYRIVPRRIADRRLCKPSTSHRKTSGSSQEGRLVGCRQSP